MIAEDSTPETVPVVVREGFQVNFEGTIYGPGDRVVVPVTVADQWSRWVDVATSKAKVTTKPARKVDTK